MNLGIQGRWALVSGASRGIGLGCAIALAKEGVHLVMVARDATPLEEAMASVRGLAQGGSEVRCVAADITTPAGREAVFAVQPDLDIIVTNAAGPPPGDFRDWGREHWMQALEANMLTPIALMQLSLDGMAARGFGRVVNITSSAVKAPIDILGLSNGARGGLTGFVAGLARRTEFASRNVTINNVLPGSFDTARLKATLESAARQHETTLERFRQERISMIPARRFGAPEEFGAICAFLCSAHAGYITGQNILVDGGAYPGVH